MEPDEWSCCAFAGDRGLLHPELTASATAAEARALAGHADAAHVSVNRTCEMGMTRATGQPYRHVLELLDDVTHPSQQLDLAPQPGTRRVHRHLCALVVAQHGRWQPHRTADR